MKRFYFYATLLCLFFMLGSCSSDDSSPAKGPEEPGMTPPSAAVFKNLQAAALDRMTQRTKFNAEDGIQFVSKQGAELNIHPGNLYTHNGMEVTGEVELEFIEFYDRASMVLANKPLMGHDGIGGFIPLITGGQFYVNVTQGGVGLKTYYYEMTVPAQNTGGLDLEMTMWEGSFNADGNLEWREFNPTTETGGVYPNAEANEYVVYLRDFGWSNIDVLSAIEGEKTPIQVRVPQGYDNKNSSVFVSYKGQTDVLAFLDQYDVASKTFTEHYGWGPIGFEMYVIFVSESAGGLIYAIQEVKLEKDKVITIAASDLKKATEAELTAIIKALP